MKTPFEKAVESVLNGTLNVPSVSYSGSKIPYFKYQLAVHHFNLKIMSSGMKCRGIILKDLKAYYGLKGRSASECLVQFEEVMNNYLNQCVQMN